MANTANPSTVSSRDLGKSVKLCPKCGKRASFHLKPIPSKGGKVYHYWYAAHYRAKKRGVRWCYLGKESINTSTSLYLNDAVQRQEKPISHLG